MSFGKIVYFFFSSPTVISESTSLFIISACFDIQAAESSVFIGYKESEKLQIFSIEVQLFQNVPVDMFLPTQKKNMWNYVTHWPTK